MLQIKAHISNIIVISTNVPGNLMGLIFFKKITIVGDYRIEFFFYLPTKREGGSKE